MTKTQNGLQNGPTNGLASKGFFSMDFNVDKYREKFVILQSIGIIVIKSKKTRVITYTCRYSSGNLIPNLS